MYWRFTDVQKKINLYTVSPFLFDMLLFIDKYQLKIGEKKILLTDINEIQI